MIWWPKLKTTTPRRQIDPIECGAVCLGIILEYFGHGVDYASLRSETGVSRNGSDAEAIILAARKYSLTGQAKKLLASELTTELAPAILFFDNCHFVVFEGVRFRRYYINDPARGRYSLDRASFHRRYSKVAIVFAKGPNFVIKKSAPSFAHAFKPKAIVASALGILAALYFAVLANMASMLPQIIHRWRYDFSWIMGCVVVALLVGFVLVLYIAEQLVLVSAGKELHKRDANLVARLFNVSPQFFADRPFRIAENILTNSVNRACADAENGVARIFWLSFVVVVVVETARIAPVIAALFVFAWLVLWIDGLINASHRDLPPQSHLSLRYALSQSRTLLAMGQIEAIVESLLRSLPTRGERPINFTLLWLAPLVFAGEAVVAAYLWQNNKIYFTDIVEIMLLLPACFYALHRIVSATKNDVDERIAMEQQINQFASPLRKNIRPHDSLIVALDNVGYTFPGETTSVLSNINFAISRGEIIGMVAASQSGMSTLMRIIGGWVLPSSGQIFFSDSKNAPARVILINEDSALMPATLRDNICLFHRNISDDTVVAALSHAHASDIFYSRPMGLLARIKAHGTNLSASEKIRLLLAQAIAHKPDLIAIDDGLMEIDDNIAASIIDNMRALNIAVVFNSYSSHLLNRADRVALLERKAIYRWATHEQLHASDAHYRSLVGESAIAERFI